MPTSTRRHLSVTTAVLCLTLFAPAQSLDALKPLIVMINGDAQGAGIVFRLDDSRRAWILTAHHVIAGKQRPTVRFANTDDPVAATIRPEASVENDLAVLTAPAPGGYQFPFHLTALPGAVGQAVRALGNPGGEAWTQTFTGSTIANVGSSEIKVESPVIDNGYSGGALADDQGRVIAMILRTNGITARAFRLDRALDILRSDLKLKVDLGNAATSSGPTPPPASPQAPAGLAAGTPRTNPKDGLVYRWIPPGTFMMGCSPGDYECYDDEKPPRRASIATGFWIGETEVTQAAYQKVTGKNPSYFKGPQRPVETVNWDEASAYCNAAGLRLPTEAEWEYAARAGSTAPRYGDLALIANTGSSTEDVGKRPPNTWGLRDTLGNVWEWTSGWYEPNKTRVARGGSWINYPRVVRVSYRDWYVPTGRLYNIGFRCAGEFR